MCVCVHVKDGCRWGWLCFGVRLVLKGGVDSVYRVGRVFGLGLC